MIRLVEAGIFGAAAAGLHVAALAAIAGLSAPGGPPPVAGAPAAMAGTDSTFAIAAPDPALRDLVELWRSPPAASAEAPAQPSVPATTLLPVPPVPPRPEAPDAIALPAPSPPSPVAPPDRAARAAAPAPAFSGELAPRPARRPADLVVPDRPARSATAPATAAPPPAPGQSGRAAIPAVAPAPAAAAAARDHEAAVRTALARALRYPERARARGITGSATVEITLDRSGRLVGLRLAESSGSAILDEAALHAARSVGRFPAAPPERPGPRLVYTAPMRFD